MSAGTHLAECGADSHIRDPDQRKALVYAIPEPRSPLHPARRSRCGLQLSRRPRGRLRLGKRRLTDRRFADRRLADRRLADRHLADRRGRRMPRRSWRRGRRHVQRRGHVLPLRRLLEPLHVLQRAALREREVVAHRGPAGRVRRGRPLSRASGNGSARTAIGVTCSREPFKTPKCPLRASTARWC